MTSTSTSPQHGETSISLRDLRVIARIVGERTGIEIADSKAALVSSRLADRVRALRLPGFSAYCEHIQSPAGADELGAVISALTTNVTRFFREPHHFADLDSWTRAELAPRARSGGRVRLWSAACSTGEEPYSIAMTVLAALPEAPALDLRILATDIDPQVLAHAERGRYPVAAAASVPEALREAHLEARGDDPARLEVSAAARSLVTFRELNLVAPLPLKGPFDAIFCRNVTIYFAPATQARVWTRLAQLLGPEGRLYVGHSERVADPAAARLAPAGPTIYRRAEPARPTGESRCR